MKKSLSALACAAALVPVAALASIESASYSDSDVTQFTSVSNEYTVLFSWADILSAKALSKGTLSYEGDGDYWIKLTNSSHGVVASYDPLTLSGAAGLSGDIAGVTTGVFALTFSGLNINETYKLVFSGEWLGSGLGLNETQTPFVQIGALSPAPVVPEPETYAMLLAGLGMVGVVARRRRQS